MRILNREAVRAAVPMIAAIDAVAGAFAQLSLGKAVAPLRTPLAQPAHQSHTFFMPALLAERAGLGLKVVSVFPHNQERHGLPGIHAIVVLIDATTGQPSAVLDGTYLTALRTGAASGAATRALARDDARVLAIFGAGAQAPQQVEAVCAVRPIDRVLIVNRSRGRADALRAMLRASGLPADIDIAADGRSALAQADVVCCATSSHTPLFDDADVRPGTHINGIGSFTPQMAEVPVATIARSRVVVDQRLAAWHESGDLVAARAAGALDEAHVTELGEIIAGVRPGRDTAGELTFFKSVGNAVQDIAVAQVALAMAQANGLGTVVPLA